MRPLWLSLCVCGGCLPCNTHVWDGVLGGCVTCMSTTVVSCLTCCLAVHVQFASLHHQHTSFYALSHVRTATAEEGYQACILFKNTCEKGSCMFSSLQCSPLPHHHMLDSAYCTWADRHMILNVTPTTATSLDWYSPLQRIRTLRAAVVWTDKPCAAKV